MDRARERTAGWKAAQRLGRDSQMHESVSEGSWGGPVARRPRAKTPTEDPHHTFLLENSLNLSQLCLFMKSSPTATASVYKRTVVIRLHIELTGAAAPLLREAPFGGRFRADV